MANDSGRTNGLPHLALVFEVRKIQNFGWMEVVILPNLEIHLGFSAQKKATGIDRSASAGQSCSVVASCSSRIGMPLRMG